VTSKAITRTVFESCFTATCLFDLRWEDFYASLVLGLRRDALKRFDQYFELTPPTATIVAKGVAKRKADDAPTDNDEEIMKRVRRR
jgi:hypothetical protein